MAMEQSDRKVPPAGFRTEYCDNYKWDDARGGIAQSTRDPTCLSHEQTSAMASQFTRPPPAYHDVVPTMTQAGIPNTEFLSQTFPSVYREPVIHKDDRGSYIDPFKGHATKPYGRRLIYDPSHPMKMYPSQWSSELADAPGVYSFPTTTGLDPEQPWRKDMAWRLEGQEAHWPTEQWKEWTQVAECPPYTGHSDQPEYHPYKTQGPWPIVN